MEQKWKTIMGVVGFVVFIGLSVLGYNMLSKQYKTQNDLQLAVKEQDTQNQDNNETSNNEIVNSDTSNNDKSDNTNEKAADEEKMKAVDFTVLNADLEEVKLSDFEGKPTVLNFWASWCPPCKSEMPEFEKVWTEVGEDINFLMINMTDGQRETQEKAKDFITEKGYEMPVYYDTTQEAAYLYGITSLPTTIFIDKNGYLITGATGAIDEATLRKGIEMTQETENIDTENTETENTNTEHTNTENTNTENTNTENTSTENTSTENTETE